MLIDRWGEGVKKIENFADVIYGSPLRLAAWKIMGSVDAKAVWRAYVTTTASPNKKKQVCSR